MRPWFLIPCLAATLAGAAPALAQNATLVTSVRPESVAAALREAGYRAELTKDGSGDPLIRSAASGVNFSVFFYGCTANKECDSIQFYAGFKKKGITPDAINRWNTTNRFGRAYLDDEKEPRVEMDVVLDAGGASPALFKSNVMMWESVLGAFLKAIDF